MVGITEGHAELLAMIDQWLSSLEAASAEERANPDESTLPGR
jgi:hypothetical protein